MSHAFASLCSGKSTMLDCRCKTHSQTQTALVHKATALLQGPMPCLCKHCVNISCRCAHSLSPDMFSDFEHVCVAWCVRLLSIQVSAPGEGDLLNAPAFAPAVAPLPAGVVSLAAKRSAHRAAAEREAQPAQDQATPEDTPAVSSRSTHFAHGCTRPVIFLKSWPTLAA